MSPLRSKIITFLSGDYNNVGIGTTSPNAGLDIESNGVPLKIEKNTANPPATQAGQMFMGNDNILYTFDSSGSKLLSVDHTINWMR